MSDLKNSITWLAIASMLGGVGLLAHAQWALVGCLEECEGIINPRT